MQIKMNKIQPFLKGSVYFATNSKIVARSILPDILQSIYSVDTDDCF